MSTQTYPTTFNLSAIERRRRVGWLGLAALVAVLALLAHGPIAQWADYHAFADARSWFGVQNASNVFSNLPFACVGAWGLWHLAREHRGPNGPWWVFCGALLVTSLTSTLYHLAPANDTLIGDRLAIAWACAALTCAFLGERVSPRWADGRTLGMALVGSSLSVAWWWATDQFGSGDLRAYLFVQFGPMIIVPLGLLLHLAPHASAEGSPHDGEGPRRAESWVRPWVTPDPAWWAVLALYALAKLLELADGWLWAATHGVISGHPLKHVIAALAAASLLRARFAARAAWLPRLRASPAFDARPRRGGGERSRARAQLR